MNKIITLVSYNFPNSIFCYIKSGLAHILYVMIRLIPWMV